MGTVHYNAGTDHRHPISGQGFAKAQERLKDLKKGGTAGQQKQRERLTRSNVKKDDDCVIM